MKNLINLVLFGNRKRLFLTFLMAIIFSITYGQEAVDYSGHFTGKAKIIVDWCNLDSLSFDIIIDDEGVVTGNVGDANIIQGKVKKNSFGSTTYIIEAELEGYIVKNEGIKRGSIKVPFDIKKGRIVGGFGTSGSKFGGKENMILSGSGLVLIRQ